jgi:two-component system response regulator
MDRQRSSTAVREILLVEDTEADADAIRKALEDAGVLNPVRHISNGMAAMTYLNQADEAAAIGPPVPAILLLDIKLPGLNGFDILERIQNRPSFNKTLRIVLSQIDDLRSIKRGYALGAHSFLSKPLKQSDLSELIQAFPGYWSFAATRGGRGPATAMRG